MTQSDDGVAKEGDPRGLIRESYRIEGIGAPECRSIFLDWAISLPDDADAEALRDVLYRIYAPAFPDHPMTEVLQEGLGGGGSDGPGGRRGGARGRRQT